MKIKNFKVESRHPQVIMIYRLAIMLFILAFSRMLLYLISPSLFPEVTTAKFWKYAFCGLRFDITALLYGNALYILLMAVPFVIRHNKLYNKIADIIFCVCNSILILPNHIDVIYYRFSLKRLTSDIFKYMSTGGDTVEMIPRYLQDFWYLLLLLLSGIAIIIWSTKIFKISKEYPKQNRKYYLKESFIFLAIAALTILGMRGGFQLKPTGIQNASEYAPSHEQPLVLNSAFTIMTSHNLHDIQKKEYFADELSLSRVFNPFKNYAPENANGTKVSMDKKNIVVIIMESFSAEYVGALNKLGKSEDFTPFLDSLIHKSVLLNGYANGKRSIEGIPAVLASLPTWMTEDYITSLYATNEINSFASLLKTQGYNTSFFHGGKNGTMGFDLFCKMAGFEHYYGKNEYPNPKDYDGYWGIWDEPFFQYFGETLNTFRQPFFSAIFSLSSHHPYQIPEKYKGKFKKGNLPINETIMYADYALKQFFDLAKTMPWYNNTVFVITADHTSEAVNPFFQNRVGQYTIPIVVFSPSLDIPISQGITAQQTDIMPTILDLLHYPHPFIAFGNSLLQPNEPKFALSYLNGNYQLVKDNFIWQSDDYSSKLYNLTKDSLLNNDISKIAPDKTHEMDQLLKAIIQQYNNRLISNKLTAKAHE